MSTRAHQSALVCLVLLGALLDLVTKWAAVKLQFEELAYNPRSIVLALTLPLLLPLTVYVCRARLLSLTVSGSLLGGGVLGNVASYAMAPEKGVVDWLAIDSLGLVVNIADLLIWGGLVCLAASVLYIAARKPREFTRDV